MAKTRTLIIHPAPAPYRVDLFNRLADALDLEVVFQRGQIAYHRELDQDALRSQMRCRASRLPGNWVVMKRDVPLGVRRLVREKQPEVVVTSEFSLVSALVAAERGRSAPAFGHVIWSDENVHTLAGHGRVRDGLRRSLARRADAMVMCSGVIADAFSQRFGLDRSRLFACGVHQDPEALRRRLAAAGPAARERIERHGLEGRRVVLYVGRLAPEKNLPVAIRAFQAAFSGDPSVVLVLVGTGSEREGLERLCRELGVSERVRFAGHEEGNALYAWYRLASVLILASTHEPYGAVVNEALVCGVPVLCSDRAGASVLVREGGNGHVIAPTDPGKIADRLSGLGARLAPAEALAEAERPDLMPVPFARDVEGFLAAVQCAAGIRAARAEPDRKVGARS